MKSFLNEIKDIANNTIKKGYTVCLIIKTNEKMSQEAYSFLTKSEQEHADKFIHAVDRHMSIISHAIKRHTISILTSIPELNLYFNCNAYGKPECTLENSPFFNISHSNKFVAIGFSLYKPLGVDIEFPRDNDYKSISSDCLNQQELSEYKDSDFNKHYFITRWTQKEALTSD